MGIDDKDNYRKSAVTTSNVAEHQYMPISVHSLLLSTHPFYLTQQPHRVNILFFISTLQVKKRDCGPKKLVNLSKSGKVTALI